MELPGDIPRNFAHVALVEQEWLADLEAYRRRKAEEEANQRRLLLLDAANDLGVGTNTKLAERFLAMEATLREVGDRLNLVEMLLDHLLERAGLLGPEGE